MSVLACWPQLRICEIGQHKPTCRYRSLEGARTQTGVFYQTKLANKIGWFEIWATRHEKLHLGPRYATAIVMSKRVAQKKYPLIVTSSFFCLS
jgi:hypothetical protein